MPNLEGSASRELRVFLSGTFLDMQAEREYLVKHVFPEIRQLCRERGVIFTDVDLRWGITANEARRGKVVALCLEEVIGREPYVLGLVGERYGWRPTPDEVLGDPEMNELYPWLAGALEERASLMEIETLRPALHEPGMKERIRFYSKKPVIPRDFSLPASVFEDLRLLDDFRERLRASGLPLRENYETPQQLGEWVREDLLNLLETLYPAGYRTSWLGRERRGHESFAATRRRAYVENRKILAQIDSYVEEGAWRRDYDSVIDQSGSRSLPLVITGESGAGKSALLAHWSEQFRSRNPDAFLVTHYVGATASSTDHVGLLRRIMQEIRERYGISEEPPAEPDRIVREFPQWLAYGSGAPMVLVVDGINQLESRSDRSAPLYWLPEDFLPHIRLIISTVEKETAELVTRREWPELRVEPLNEGERREVARRFLGDHGKRLDNNQLQRVARSFKSGNPLYLRTSLEELRVFGRYEKLNERIDHYLEAEDLESLFERVLERIEKDYGKSLVSTTMRLLWGARHGLSEQELHELTGAGKARVARLLQALDYHLMRRDGLLTFFHNHLREAAQKRYVRSRDAARKTHRLLARYFAGQPLSGARREEEEPWQWKEAEAWDDLERCLTTIPLLCKLCEGEKKYEALRYWQAFPDAEEKEIGASYRQGLARLEKSETLSPLELASMLETLGGFLFDCAEYEEAEHLYRRALAIRQEDEKDQGKAISHTLTRLGGVLREKGNYEEAEKTLRQALALTERAYGPGYPETAAVLETLGALLYTTRDYKEAETLCARALEIREQTLGPEHPDSITSLSTLGAIFLNGQQSGRAVGLLQQALQLSERAMGPEHPMTASSLNNLAVAFRYQDAFAEAIPLLERAISINEKIFGSHHPEVAANLTNLASLEKKVGKLEEAERHSRQALAIYRAVLGENHSAVARSLSNLGTLLKDTGKSEEAGRAYEEAALICEKVFGPDHINTHRSLLNLAFVMIDRAEYQQAMSIFRRSVPALRRMLGPNHPEFRRFYEYFTTMPREFRDMMTSLDLEKELLS